VTVLTFGEKKLTNVKNWSHNLEFFVLAKNMKLTQLFLLLAPLFLAVCIYPNLSVHVNQDAEWGGPGFNGSLTVLKGPVLMKSLPHTLPLLSQSKYFGS
jgi:hypothetical protein